MKNPLFKSGIKSGTHHLGGVGEIKRIRLRDIHSPQRSVDEKKVAALARFTKNMPGTPTASHVGGGKYVLKDGNHRVNAALRQGKRVIDVRVQKLSSLSPLIQFTTLSATKNLLRDLRAQGVGLNRKSGLAAYDNANRTIHVPKFGNENTGPRNLLWHEAGHAEAHTSGMMDDFLKMKSDPATLSASRLAAVGQKSRAYSALRTETRNQERLANDFAQRRMVGEGVPAENIADYRSGMAPGLNTYRAGYKKVFAGKPMANKITRSEVGRIEKIPSRYGFSSPSPLIQFMHCTAEAVPRVDLKRKIVKKRINTDPIRRLSSSLDGILNFATGKYMNKFLPGTMWGEDEQHVTTTGRVQTKPTIAKQIYKAAIEQRDPVAKTTVVNRSVPKDHPDRYIVKKESPVKTKDVFRPHPSEKNTHVLGKLKTIADQAAPGGERYIKASDLLNTEGYRNAKMEQMKHAHAEQIQSGYHPHDLEGKGLTGAQQEILQRGLAGAKTPEQVGAVNKAARKVRSSLIPGDVKPEMGKVRDAIARDVEINRRIVHAIRRAPFASSAFLSDKVKSAFGPGGDRMTAEHEAKVLADARSNFDEHLAGENVRRKLLATKVHEHVFKRAQHAMVAEQHGADWKTKLTQREQAKALESKLGPARKLTESIKSNVAPEAILDKTTGAVVEHPHGTLANLIGAKPETMEKFRQKYNSLASSDFATNRKVENDIIKSGKIFDNKDVFTAPEAVKTDLKKFPTLKKIGIAGAVLGGGALAYHLYNKRKKSQEQQQEPEPQKMLMSRRGRIIQFGKKIPKLPFGNKLSEIIPKDILKAGQKAEVTRLINKKEGVASATEAAMQHIPEARIPGHENIGGGWNAVDAAKEIAPEAIQQVSGAKRAIVRAAKKPQGIKKLTPAQVLGDELAASAKPTAIEALKQHLSNTQRRVEPVAGRGGRVTKLLGLKPEMASVASNDVVGVMEGFAKKIPSSVPGKFRGKKPLTPEQAWRTIQAKRPILASQARELRNKLRGFKRDNGESFDAVQTRLRAEALTAQNAAQEATIRAEQEIAHNQNANHEALKNQASSMREAREKALAGQASGHKKAIEDTKSAGWRNTAIGTGVGLIGGALVAGNASRQTYQPKKQLHQPERKLLMSSRRKIIRFERNEDVRKKSTLGHDIATGALEGGIVGPFTEPFYSKLREGKWGARGGTWVSNVMPGGPLSKKGWTKFGKNAVIGAGLGATSTAIVGAGVNVMDKKRRERLKKEGKAILFKAVTPSPRGAIARDKYDNAVFDQDEKRAEHNYKRSALAGGGLSVLLRGKKTRLGTFIAGAGAGIGTQLATRSITAASKDQFGDRSHLAKRIDRLPWQVPALIAGGIIGKRAWKAGALKMSSKGKLIQFMRGDRMESMLKTWGSRQGDGVSLLTQKALNYPTMRPILRRDPEALAEAAGVPIGVAHQMLPPVRKQMADQYWKDKKSGLIGASGQSVERLKRHRKMSMSARGGLIQFGYYSEDDMDSALRAQKDDDRLWRKANTQSNKIVQGAKRGTRLTQDLLRAVKGQKNLDSRGRERKREWEKPWVRTAVTGTLMAGTAYGFHKIIKHSGPGSSLGQMKELYHQGVYHDAARAKVPGFAKVHDWVKGFKKKGTDEAASVAENSGVIGKINKWAVKAAGKTGSKPVVTQANIKTAASAAGAPSAPAVDMAKETIKREQEQLRKLREAQEKGPTFSSKSKLIRFRSEDDHASLDDYAEEHGKKSKKYRDAHEKWLRLQPGKRQRDRRDATFSETKSGQQLIYRGKMAAALLGGALGARMLGKRMDAGNMLASGVTKAPRRNLSEKYGEAIAASSRDPFITLNSRLTRLLQFGTRTLKTGHVVTWGKDLPMTKMFRKVSDTRKGAYKITDPATGAEITVNRTRGAEPMEGNVSPSQQKWWKGKNAYIGLMKVPKENRSGSGLANPGGKAMIEILGGTRKNSEGKLAHSGLFGHFDKAGITTRTVASGYQKRSIPGIANATHDRVSMYQRKGFRLDPNRESGELAVSMIRSPGEKKHAAISEKSLRKYISGKRKQEVKKASEWMGHYMDELPGKALMGVSAATGGAAIMAKKQDDKSPAAKTLAVTSAAAGIPAAYMAGKYLHENAGEIGSWMKHGVVNAAHDALVKRAIDGRGRIQQASQYIMKKVAKSFPTKF